MFPPKLLPSFFFPCSVPLCAFPHSPQNGGGGMDVRGPRPPALGGHGGPHPVCGHTKGTLPGIWPLSPFHGSNIFAPRKTDPLVNPPVCAHTPSHLEAQLCQLGLHTPICCKVNFHFQVLSNFHGNLDSIAHFLLQPPPQEVGPPSPFHSPNMPSWLPTNLP